MIVYLNISTGFILLAMLRSAPTKSTIYTVYSSCEP